MNAIVIAAQNWAIGREGRLLFSLPTDMKRFRALTLGGTVILGRRTLDSFPGGRPLKGRRNIVITRKEDFDRMDVEIASNPEAALELAAEAEPIWIIGGGSVYAALLARCKRVYLTRVDTDALDADTFFPNLDKLHNWEIESVSDDVTENGFTYRFMIYVNQKLPDVS